MYFPEGLDGWKFVYVDGVYSLCWYCIQMNMLESFLGFLQWSLLKKIFIGMKQVKERFLKQTPILSSMFWTNRYSNSF
jgi:hypothetical protein